MKRWLGLFVAVWMMTLTACSEAVPPAESTLTAREVYDLITERASHFHSASVAITLEQMKSIGEDEQLLISADLTGKTIEKPLSMYQAGNVSLHYPPLGMIDLDVELYAADDSIYVHENVFDQWIKISVNDLVDFGIQLNEKHSLSTFFEKMDRYIDDFKLEQTKNTFIFTLTPTTEQFQRHLIEEMRPFYQTNLTGIRKTNEYDIDHEEQVDVSFTIDKETYDILSVDVEAYTKVIEREETITVITSIRVDFSNINEVKDITIPQKAIDEAIQEHPLMTP